jgi:hypothetical protein
MHPCRVAFRCGVKEAQHQDQKGHSPKHCENTVPPQTDRGNGWEPIEITNEVDEGIRLASVSGLLKVAEALLYQCVPWKLVLTASMSWQKPKDQVATRTKG